MRLSIKQPTKPKTRQLKPSTMPLINEKTKLKKTVSQATGKTKAVASEAAKDVERRVRAELLTGKKLDPNKVTGDELKAALGVVGVGDADKIVKDVEAARPFTADNMESKVKEIAKQNNIDDNEVKLIHRYMEVGKSTYP